MKKIWGYPQVSPNHYFTSGYLSKDRFSGLYGQVRSCLNNNEDPKTILEIGPGPGLFSAFLKQFGKDVTTLDFTGSLPVDILARLPELPLKSDAFDLVCAFEVLEHLPFSKLSECFMEMSRVTHSTIAISVPNVSKLKPIIKFSIDIRIKKFKVKNNISWSKNKKLFNDKEHYWEIGINGINTQTIIQNAISVNLKVVETYFVDPWFQFFIFEK